jgi:hypothetical protein
VDFEQTVIEQEDEKSESRENPIPGPHVDGALNIEALEETSDQSYTSIVR